jgi:hypothetical protein
MTRWPFHPDKKVNDVDSSQFKDGNTVICKGASDKAGVLRATLISKRLSHSMSFTGWRRQTGRPADPSTVRKKGSL